MCHSINRVANVHEIFITFTCHMVAASLSQAAIPLLPRLKWHSLAGRGHGMFFAPVDCVFSMKQTMMIKNKAFFID